MKYFATKISENMHRTPEGYLLCMDVPIAHCNEMEYAEGETPLEVGPNGTITISRARDEIFSAETIASFEGKPLTIKHPEDFVGPDNWKELAKGHMTNVRQGKGDQADDLLTDILITDAATILLVEEGLRGLSCGYEAEYIQTGKGKGLQKNIVGNHLALVEEGRAGDAYQINDHKGVLRMSKKLADKIKAAFSKTVDEAIADEAAAPAPEKKDKAADAQSMDELVKAVKDLVTVMSKGKDKADPAPAPEKKAADEEPPVVAAPEKPAAEASMEDRMKALEMAVSKILEKLSEGDSDDEDSEEESEDEESDEIVDADEEGEEGDVADTGDTASRAEILCPGIKKTKDVKSAALKAAYKTKDGKKIIDALSAGKPNFDNAEKVDTLFVAASELLKVARGEQLSQTRKTRDFSSAIFKEEGHMTPEKMNEKNAKIYGPKQ